MSTNNLDPVHYFTPPGFSFDCILKYTGMELELELFTDYAMLLMVEQGIRRGLSKATMYHVEANNFKTPDYDPEKPDTWTAYQDCFNFFFLD